MKYCSSLLQYFTHSKVYYRINHMLIYELLCPKIAIAIAIAFGCEQDFDELFSHRQYTSIQEVIDTQREARKQ